MTVACLALRQDGAGGDVKSGKEGGGAMANGIVGHSFHITKSHGQHRLGPIESLNLRLLIDTEHDRVVRRVQVEPHHIPDFSMKNGSLDSLKFFVR